MTGPPDSAALAMRGVGKSYGSGRRAVEAVRDVSLRLAPGSFTTLFGPSGCGKSTLLRMAAGLEAVTAGTVEVLGRAPHQAARDKDVAWVPQSPALLPWRSVRANARLADDLNRRADRRGRSVRRPRDADAVLAEVGLADALDRRPGELSGGMAQRAALARAFVHGAPLLLLDEPFSAVDDLVRARLRELLLALWQRHRTTVVLVTHSATEAVVLSDRVVVLSPRPGQVVAVVDVPLGRGPGERAEGAPGVVAATASVAAALRRGEGASGAPAA